MYKDAAIGRMRLKIYLLLYDFMAGGASAVGRHSHLTSPQLLSRYPFLSSIKLTSGYVYGDTVTDDARLTLDVVRAALTAGAVAVNYAEVLHIIRDERHVTGVEIIDRETGRQVSVSARAIVNAAGPWIGNFASKTTEMPVRLTKGVHLVLPGLPSNDGFLIKTSQDDRIIFLIPWYGRTLLGTTDTDYTGDPDDPQIDDNDIDYLLFEANRILKDIQWGHDSILGAYAGLRALTDQPGRAPSVLPRRWSAIMPEKGLFVSIGGKLTSARTDTHKLVDRVMKYLGHPGEKSPREQSLPYAQIKGNGSWTTKMIRQGVSLGLEQDMADWAIFRHGTNIHTLYELLSSQPDLARPLLAGLPFCTGEVVMAARSEMALHLEDILRRRIPLTVLARQDSSVVQTVARLAGNELGWSNERIASEAESVLENWWSP
jgi:glycerol-3-phosphate dehydrogenase